MLSIPKTLLNKKMKYSYMNLYKKDRVLKPTIHYQNYFKYKPVVFLCCVLWLVALVCACSSGGGASPNSAISDRYSSSIFALSPGVGGPP